MSLPTPPSNCPLPAPPSKGRGLEFAYPINPGGVGWFLLDQVLCKEPYLLEFIFAITTSCAEDKAPLLVCPSLGSYTLSARGRGLIQVLCLDLSTQHFIDFCPRHKEASLTKEESSPGF